MSATLLVLDRQAKGRIFSFGTTAASNESLLTLYNGTAAASNVNLDVKGSVNIGGDLNLTGNLNITGSINEQTVTNLQVTDITITLNKGGNTAGAAGGGILMEGTSAAVVAAIKFDNTLTSKWSVGDGTTQREIADVSSAQTITGKTLNASNNTFTDTSAAQGDLLWFNSTKFVRFARGTASQQLRVNAGGTDIEWFTPSSSAATKATNVSGTQDGSNKVFTLASSVAANSELIYLNGQLLTPGSSNDYVLSGTTLTFQSGFTAPAATDVIRAYGSY